MAKTRRSKKVGCPIEIYASVDDKGDWIIRRVMLDHQNHQPTPMKSKDVPAFRKRNLLDKEKNLGQSGKSSLKFKGHSKENKEEVMLNLSGGDARAMVDYFNKLTADNQNFFHMERYAERGGLQDIVWVDARSRAAFEEFGDVIVFDATYLTNKYRLLYANFCGVNHHMQTILFGCALLSRETAETYSWLCTTWLNCISGKVSSGKLTNQDPAMRRALKETMKDTTHRWCLWHILQKFPKYLNKHENYEDLKADLENVIYDSSDPVTFEMGWNDVIVHYAVKENANYKWLEDMYDERHGTK
ncbi:protein FAR1-RELATED SEQUENCE 5-like [Spinacia oleracea]|uniref:Protein FAR1-RELATED SEQUENCE 5-like n=1 Tax=Spinacia oleracea TaxID=3562 RepID=A0A9R0JIC0_SPIOL|nr:protein FAR1-RELATED SEQUENCE 5-like [Spinacia oleracea]